MHNFDVDRWFKEVLENPHFYEHRDEYYKELSACCPIAWSNAMESWIVSERNLIKASLSGNSVSVVRTRTVERLPSELRELYRDLDNFYSRWLLLLDEPAHMQLKRPVQSQFTAAKVEFLEKNVSRVIKSTGEKLKSLDSFDLINDFSNPVAARILLDFIGLNHIKSETGHRWAKTFFNFLINRTPTSVDAFIADSARLEVMLELDRAATYGDKNSLLKRCKERLGHEEALILCASVLVDGIEPLANLIGTSLIYWMESANTQDLVVRTPLIVEISELIAKNSPFQYIARRAANDHLLGGKSIRENERLMFLIGAANADDYTDRRFPPQCPAREHLAFGYGKHFCLGSSIAKVVLKKVMEIAPSLFSNFYPMPNGYSVAPVFAAKYYKSYLVRART
jgi:pimeloyl-[acyl-carrier protein] synthase